MDENDASGDNLNKPLTSSLPSNIVKQFASDLIDQTFMNNDNNNDDDNVNDNKVSPLIVMDDNKDNNNISSIMQDSTDDTNAISVDKQQTNHAQQQEEKQPLFLTIDHKLAIERRNMGQLKAFEECDTPSPMVTTTPPLLKQFSINKTMGTTTSSSTPANKNNAVPTVQLNGSTILKHRTTAAKTSLANNNNISQDSDSKINGNHHFENVKCFVDQKCKSADNKDFQANLKKKMSSLMRRFLISTFMTVFITVVECYTWLTLPIYYLIQKPWIKRQQHEHCRVKVFQPETSNTTTNITTDQSSKQQSSPMDAQMSPIYERDEPKIYNHSVFRYPNLISMFDSMTEEYGDNRHCLGYRQVLSEEASLDENGKPRRIDGRQLKQYRLSEYKWLSYKQVGDVAQNLAQGFMNEIGIEPKMKVLIISETRIEWMLCFRGVLKTGATLVTVFSNLGVEGVAHAIDESQADSVITSIECMPLLKQALSQSKHKIKNIIYMDGIKEPDVDFGPEIKMMTLSSVEATGKKLVNTPQAKPYYKPQLEDLIVIMYTSGTTGPPKAATISHVQMNHVMKALFVLVKDIMDEAPYHTYISYLPMAHILELTLEVFFNLGGVRLGYASPFTLTDSAPGLCRGQIPDIKLLKPTVMTTVPLVLDRIIKEMNDKLRSRTPVSLPVVNYLIDYKSKWTNMGYRCDLVTKLVCPKVREQLGGNLVYMICGGAPLNANTQATIRSALDVTFVQGYGATETSGATFAADFKCLGYGHVGGPLGDVYFRLRDWTEGGYSINDKPNPRGELLIGGNIVAFGYFNRPQLSEESFHTDEHGIRWFYSGDIAELQPNGTIKIIDRCKDLIKLQNGEYISLGKVEAALKACHLVDNVCVYGGTFSNDIVALISPNRKALTELVRTLNKMDYTIEQQCNDPQIQQIVLEEVIKTAKHVSLGKKEIPRRIKLVPEEWSPDNGILTAAMKLKRRSVESMYKQELYDLYNDKKFNQVITTNGYDQNNNKPINNNNNSSLSMPDQIKSS